MEQNYLDRNLDCDLELYLDCDPEDACDIHCSKSQITSHCCSLFSHCYIAIHLISGLKLHGTKFFDPDRGLDRDPDNFALCKQDIRFGLIAVLT